MMLEIGTCAGIENYSRHLSRRVRPASGPACLFDYFPDDFLVVVDESHVTLPQIGGMFNGDRARKLTLVDYGFRLPSALDNRPLMFDEFLSLDAARDLRLGHAGRPRAAARREGVVVEQIIRPTGLVDPEIEVRPVRGQVDDLLDEIRIRERKGERVLVTTLTKRMAEDLTDYLQQMGVRVRYMHSDIDAIERMEIVRGLRLGEFDVLVGINLLREGLDLPEVSLVADSRRRPGRAFCAATGRSSRRSAARRGTCNGRAIFYADRITGSMQRCIDETTRRREIQRRTTSSTASRRAPSSSRWTRCGSRPTSPTRARSVPSPRARSEAVDLRDPARRAALVQSLERQMRRPRPISNSSWPPCCATSSTTSRRWPRPTCGGAGPRRPGCAGAHDARR